MEKKRTEGDVRRLMTFEMACSGKSWEVASLLEKNRQGIAPDESTLVYREMRHFKLS